MKTSGYDATPEFSSQKKAWQTPKTWRTPQLNPIPFIETQGVLVTDQTENGKTAGSAS